MSEKMKNTVVPRLRFPEFLGDEEWLITTIGEIGKFYYGKSAPKWSLSNDAPTPCVRYGELYTKFDTVISKTYSRTNIDPSNLKFSKGGEILVPRVGEVPQDFAKHCCYLPFPNIAIGEMISVFETEEYPIFFTYYFRTLWKEFAEVVEGQNVKNLYYVNLEPIVIAKPSILEQQKIAATLTSLDDLISAQGEKLKALQAHKKGLMQQLFPAEGETVPRVRFGEFEGEWEEKTLGELGNVLMCKRIFAEETNDKEGVPFYKIGTLGGKPDAFISREHFEEFKSKYNYPRKGEILITCSGTVGKCLPYNGEEAYYQDSNIVWIDNPTLEIKNELLFYMLSNVNWGKLNSTTITRIYSPDLKGLSITFPKNPEEQQKIAACLTALDDHIAAEGQRLAALRRWKAGLMQGMFPGAGE